MDAKVCTRRKVGAIRPRPRLGANKSIQYPKVSRRRTHDKSSSIGRDQLQVISHNRDDRSPWRAPRGHVEDELKAQHMKVLGRFIVIVKEAFNLSCDRSN